MANLASRCPQGICHPALTHLHSPTAFTSTSHAQAKVSTTNQNENHQPTPRAAKMTNGDGYHDERKTYLPVPPRRQNTRYCCLWFFLSPLSALVFFFVPRLCVFVFVSVLFRWSGKCQHNPTPAQHPIHKQSLKSFLCSRIMAPTLNQYPGSKDSDSQGSAAKRVGYKEKSNGKGDEKMDPLLSTKRGSSLAPEIKW